MSKFKEYLETVRTKNIVFGELFFLSQDGSSWDKSENVDIKFDFNNFKNDEELKSKIIKMLKTTKSWTDKWNSKGIDDSLSLGFRSTPNNIKIDNSIENYINELLDSIN